ncbi:uncharacterized protein LOC131538660 isoform X2 [Onychostoma macrolepis]|nr:uncharacterized protein LOC131538660 isoform X2 [Onychostoma macrolepis]
MSTQKREVQLKADLRSTISENGNEQGGMNMTPATTEKTSPKVRKNNKSCAFFQRRWKAVKKSFQKNRVEPIWVSAEPDPEPLCVPDPEPEPEKDLVDEEQLCVAGPSAPEIQVTTESTQKREVQLKADISSTVSENGIDQGGMNMTAATTEKTSSKVKKSNKICAFFQRRWKAVKKSFQKNRVEPIGVSAEPDPEPEVDLVDEEQLCVSAPSGPEPQVTTETQETQVKSELSMLHNHFLVNIFQLERRMCKCKVLWTPVTEVWPSVFIGNEETAMDRAKLKEMGVTHILNTAAYKEYLQGKIDTRAEYYKEMDITDYSVLVMDEHRFDISKDLFPASEFIHKALSNTENKLLVHCIDGVSRSATFFLAYLMIHHEILLEDAIDHVIDKRWIRPNRDFLKQLITLNSNLLKQCKLQLRKQINTDKRENREDAVAQPVPEPLCEPGPSRPKPEAQVTKEVSVLENHVPQSILQLQDRLDECTLDWTPVTEVWPSVFIGNEDTARNRAKLKGMGITHILNAAAVEKRLKVLFEMPSKKSLKGKVNTGVTYYQGRNISYYDVPAVNKCSFNISEYFFPAAQFIHQALSKPENKVLVHCKKGISRSATLVLAYLMIHQNMMVEDAIDHVIE